MAFDFDKSNYLDMNEAKVIVLCFITGFFIITLY